MLELLKRTIHTGLGLALLTKEKIEDLGRDLVQQAKLSEGEGRELIDDLMRQAERARTDFDARIQAAVSRAVAGLNLATRSDLAALAARVDRLERAEEPVDDVAKP